MAAVFADDGAQPQLGCVRLLLVRFGFTAVNCGGKIRMTFRIALGFTALQTRHGSKSSRGVGIKTLGFPLPVHSLSLCSQSCSHCCAVAAVTAVEVPREVEVEDAANTFKFVAAIKAIRYPPHASYTRTQPV